jgi:hypothetical protein
MTLASIARTFRHDCAARPNPSIIPQLAPSAGGNEDLDHEPVDLQDVIAVPQWHIGQPTIAVMAPFAAELDPRGQFLERNASAVFLDGLVRGGLEHEPEAAFCLSQPIYPGLWQSRFHRGRPRPSQRRYSKDEIWRRRGRGRAK